MLAAEQMVIDENKRIRSQGRTEERNNIIKSLLKSNMKPSEISERTGISLSKILRLAK